LVFELMQTPLQTLAFYNAVANNGVFVKPQFVKEIRRGVEVVKTFKPVVVKSKICSQETLDVLKQCLEEALAKPLYTSTRALRELRFLSLNTSS